MKQDLFEIKEEAIGAFLASEIIRAEAYSFEPVTFQAEEAWISRYFLGVMPVKSLKICIKWL